jgi:hypothetical protein
MEIDVNDILEEVEGVGSMAPVAMDDGSNPSVWKASGVADETVKIRLQPRRQTVLRGVAVGVVGLCTTLLVTVALLGKDEAPAPAAGGSISAAPVATAFSREPAPEAPDPSPWTAVAEPSTTPPSSGTISVARGAGPLVIDGARSTATAVVVPCGSHSLRVGRGATRSVVVPCGGSLAVERSGKISVH